MVRTQKWKSRRQNLLENLRSSRWVKKGNNSTTADAGKVLQSENGEGEARGRIHLFLFSFFILVAEFFWQSGEARVYVLQ